MFTMCHVFIATDASPLDVLDKVKPEEDSLAPGDRAPIHAPAPFSILEFQISICGMFKEM